MSNPPRTSDSEGSSGDSVAAPTISDEQCIAWLETQRGTTSYRIANAILSHLRSASQEPRAAVATVARDERMSPVEGVALRDARWILHYADCDVSPEIFAGQGAEQAAKRRFDQARMNWTCVLYQEYDCSGFGPGTNRAARLAPAATAPLPVEASTGERRVNGFSVPSWNIKALGGAEMVLASDFDALAALRTDTAPGLPAPAAKPPTCGGIAPPGATPITEDEREALEYVIADNVGWIECGEKSLLDPDFAIACSNYEQVISEERADVALRKRHDATLRSLAARLSKGERG